MKNFIKHNVIFLLFFIILSGESEAAEAILPIPKPIVDIETKLKVIKKKEIYPKKRPSKEVKKIENTEVDQPKEIVFIYPENKPLIFKKKIDKAVNASAILSKRDFKIAKAVFKAIDKKKWQTAIKLSNKSRDKTLRNLINWLYLIQPSNSASFYDYISFINTNPNFPRIGRL